MVYIPPQQFSIPNSGRLLTLADYGWDVQRERSFTECRADGLIPGRVVRAERSHCDVVSEFGQMRVMLLPQADSLTPCSGDWVAIRPSTVSSSSVVAQVLERRTALVRASTSGTSRGQILAANVETVAIVTSLSDPIKLGRIERMLAMSWESGGTPVVVLTKADHCADASQVASRVAQVAPGVDVLVTSATTGDGLDTAIATLTGTVVLLGPSGVGKSTLGNRLLGEDLLVTGGVRQSDGKGRHTTAWRELLPLPHGGVLLDTPGLRGAGVHDVDQGLDQAFVDIVDLAADCRFTDCAHNSEPGCAVLAAIDSGDLAARRLDSYRRLLRENEYMASRSDARVRAERQRTKKEIARLQRETYRSGRRQR